MIRAERLEPVYSPVDRCDYELVERDLARVTERDSGRSGLFTLSGKWVSGELRSCDLNILLILRPRSATPFVALRQASGQT